MTVKKAINLTEWLLETNEKFRNGLLDPKMSWNQDNDTCKGLVGAIVAVSKRDSEVLMAILKELVPKCKHPKKMQDVCGGQRYCMNCNMDL